MLGRHSSEVSLHTIRCVMLILMTFLVYFDRICHLFHLSVHGFFEGDAVGLAIIEFLYQFSLEIPVELFAEVVIEGLFLLGLLLFGVL